VRQLMHKHGHKQQQRRDEPELVRAVQGTYNPLLDVEKLTESNLDRLRARGTGAGPRRAKTSPYASRHP
jgi:hypothetical protein